MKSLSYLRVVMMGLALLVFTFGRADAGGMEKKMKQDEMKSESMMEKPMKQDEMKSESMMEKPMKQDEMK
jgi:pentapeptide MXKDX repeat protein